MILQAAAQYGVPPNIALGVAAHESGFNPAATNLNTNGTTDYGVMQLNTSVLQTYGLTPAQALDPQTNIDTGVSLLGSYIAKYGDVDTALQAYASGPGTVASGAPPNATASQFIGYVTSYQAPASSSPDTYIADSGNWWETDITDPLSNLASDLTDSGDSSGDLISPALLAGGVVFAALALYAISA
jgi:hypothetical protein